MSFMGLLTFLTRMYASLPVDTSSAETILEPDLGQPDENQSLTDSHASGVDAPRGTHRGR
jgi:hypothetical protein